MKRIGKIAQSPEPVRERLNRRLEQEQAGKTLVAWLNGLAEVKEVLATEPGGWTIIEQNLSDWKQRVYSGICPGELSVGSAGDPPSGTRRMQKCKQAVSLRTVHLSVPSGGSPDGTGGSPVLPLECWKRLREISSRCDTTAARGSSRGVARIGHEQWECDVAREEWEKNEREEQELQRISSAPLIGQLRFAMLRRLLWRRRGGPEEGGPHHRVRGGFARGHPERDDQTGQKQASGPEESKQIHPDQTRSSPVELNRTRSRSIVLDQGCAMGGRVQAGNESRK